MSNEPRTVWCTARINLACLMEGVHIWHNDCLWYEDDNDLFQIIHMSFESKAKAKYT